MSGENGHSAARTWQTWVRRGKDRAEDLNMCNMSRKFVCNLATQQGEAAKHLKLSPWHWTRHMSRSCLCNEVLVAFNNVLKMTTLHTQIRWPLLAKVQDLDAIVLLLDVRGHREGSALVIKM